MRICVCVRSCPVQEFVNSQVYSYTLSMLVMVAVVVPFMSQGLFSLLSYSNIIGSGTSSLQSTVRSAGGLIHSGSDAGV